MKAKIKEPDYYESDIRLIDIYPASEEEAQLSSPGLSKVCPQSLVSKGPYRGFFVVAVVTFSGPDLPVETRITFPETSLTLTVIEKHKATCHIRFMPEEYEEDKAKIKAMLLEWAEERGIKFG